ncbi:MAG: PAS domain-containing protein [Deltaproteobacteria bacterium]|nr:PAS domain-containing protein [Deltaproteobacteria bacterium]MBW2448497.1 PAS domain-containing protein [Deltaproteobacteria bacterium]
MKREKAVAVGNRAGVVEWANAAWSRVTGYALEDAIAKPIGDLLETAGIEGDVIGFVRQRFERGEPCEIELPLHPPGGEGRWIHVSVESLRDRYGDVSHFAAIAWDVTAEKRRAAETPVVSRAKPSPTPRNAAPLQLSTTDLSAFVRALVNERESLGAPRTAFDLGLPDGLPWVGVDPDLVGGALAGLVRDAVAAIGDEWGTVSLNTGVAQSEAVFVSPTYPRNCLVRGLPEGHYAYIEVHDTGLPVDGTAVAALSGIEPPASAMGRVARLASARLLLQDHGGELRVDADAGFGTRVILLFPC